MELSFEEKIKKIEDIVDALENNELSMSEMLNQFELGTQLVKECREFISTSELKFINISEKINDNSQK